MARMNNEQTIDIGITPLTASGRPATIDGEARFRADPESAGTFEQLSALSARFTPAADLDPSTFPLAVQIHVEADADLDVGEERILPASGVLEITSPEAETIEVVFSEPQPQ